MTDTDSIIEIQPTINYRACYQLRARGESRNGWRFRAASRAIFASRVDAEAHILKFKERCCDESKFECAYPESLQIDIVELEFYD